jgi:hypothetical protein
MVTQPQAAISCTLSQCVDWVGRGKYPARNLVHKLQIIACAETVQRF